MNEVTKSVLIGMSFILDVSEQGAEGGTAAVRYMAGVIEEEPVSNLFLCSMLNWQTSELGPVHKLVGMGDLQHADLFMKHSAFMTAVAAMQAKLPSDDQPRVITN